MPAAPISQRMGERVMLHSTVLDLSLVTLVYLAATLAVLNQGFLEYNADGYTRIIHAYEWSRSPHWEVGVWLPLQTWSDLGYSSMTR